MTDREEARRMVRAIAVRLTDLGAALDTVVEAITLVSSDLALLEQGILMLDAYLRKEGQP